MADQQLNTGALVVSDTGHITAKDAVWYHYRPLAAFNADPGQSGATFIPPDANGPGGERLDNVTEILYFDGDIHSDWDAASDVGVNVYFYTNVDNSGGGAGDTVDMKLVCTFMGPGESVVKVQTIEEACVVGQAAQYTMFECEFVIDFDDGSNPVEVGDQFGFALNLETDTSEVDIVVHHLEFLYRTKTPNIEV